ncbi:MAG TPA: glycosyltransferase family 4 protein [Blastocatellia bacterium]|nr:glycosyltransferase family 4 protein [Blastocatellia bacterium]
MRLTLVISSLECGGSERVMTILANYWAATRKVTILTLADDATPPVYELDVRVRLEGLGVANSSPNAAMALVNNMNRLLALRRAIRESRPDVVLSFGDKTNVLTLLATRGLQIPVVVSERSDPAMNPIGRVWSKLRLWTYAMAEAIVVQSPGARNYFPANIQGRTHTIPNPVRKPATSRTNNIIKPKSLLIIGMGRLVPEKGFDILLEAFAQIKDRHPQWRLMILGEGPLREELEVLSQKLGLAGSISLPGRVSAPDEYLAGADLFVMSSRFEGFPNALCEAMASGLAVISTDCPSGPREIIRQGTDGLLVATDDHAALAEVMDRLMSDERERQRLAIRAPEVTRRFAVEHVMGMWEKVFTLAIGGTVRDPEGAECISKHGARRSQKSCESADASALS